MVDTAGVVRWLVGGGDACRVCYGAVGEGAVSLQDAVALDDQHDADTLTVRDVLAAVAGTMVDEEMLPQSVCVSCARAAFASYSFLRLCHVSLDKLRKMIVALHSCRSSDWLCPRRPTVKTLYLLLDEQRTVEMADRGRATGKLQALARVMSLADAPRAREQRGYQCEDCGRTFRQERALLRHLALHAHPHMCAICTNTYTSRRRLMTHVARAHHDKTHPCAECGKRFGSRALVEEHRRAMHIQVQCTVCGQAFTSKHAQRAHQLAHGRRWPCPRCDKTFKYKEGLKRHSARCGDAVARERYVCDDCGRSYMSKGTLVQHVRCAHGDAPHVCSHCGHKFPDAGKLRCHLSSHTGVKHYDCAVCGARFSYPSTLTYHMRALHTGERPFACDECPQTFITSSVRLVHKRRYHGAPAPVCTVCHLTFVTRARLRKHMRKHAHMSLEHMQRLTSSSESGKYVNSWLPN